VATFEEPVRNLGTKRGFIDLFGRAFCSSNKKAKVSILRKAKAQALHYFPGLKDAEPPRFMMLSDFQSFELYDLEEDESVAFLLTDLAKHIASGRGERRGQRPHLQ
jgi:hypothetical protein